MTEEFSIHELSLRFPHDKDLLIRFLAEHHLSFEEDIEAAFGIFDSEEVLVGCGCCAKKLLKCFAVNESLRGQNALGSLISRLVENRFSAGLYDLFVITRPKNETLFTSCGFYTLARTADVLMLENRREGLTRFYSGLMVGSPERREGAPKQAADGLHSETTAASTPAGSPELGTDPRVGAIVMNCNPFTKGHLALITYAAARCDLLYIFVVEEDRSQFPFAVRLALVKEGAAHLPNVRVCPSGPYMISSATFPTYFLKEGEDAAKIQSELDITLFASRIAPLFKITVRFVGEEPFDPVTRSYNDAMERILPDYGISFVKIDRISSDGPGRAPAPISASRVRRLLKEGGITDDVLSLVPPCTAAYLKETYQES
ncbi:MAG: citrate lyase ligase [Lachnospiraceae bacterium]|jgi:[citrate (pro-3S)-lyase] ligase|nr:citrate lyase ligase [Lachnospiraceae bacterium]